MLLGAGSGSRSEQNQDISLVQKVISLGGEPCIPGIQAFYRNVLHTVSIGQVDLFKTCSFICKTTPETIRPNITPSVHENQTSFFIRKIWSGYCCDLNKVSIG